jgi:SAM-dependent methyltransferase
MKSQDLDKVYGAKTKDESRAAYNGWSASYDAENIAKGFRLPALCAGLLARHLGGENGPILDAGCGTGLVGETLAILGYGPITGCDLSTGMMARAAQTGAYADFAEADMGTALPFADGHFAGFTCVGAFGPGHAPPATLRHLVRVTRPGGVGVFNVVEATWRDQGFPQMMEQLTDDGLWRVEQVTEPFRAYLLAEPEVATRAFAVRIL